MENIFRIRLFFLCAVYCLEYRTDRPDVLVSRLIYVYV